MTDTIRLPSGVEVYEGKSVRIPGLGTAIPTGDLTPAEVQALRDDVESVLGQGLGDLVDVDTSGATDGMLLAWNDADSQWEPIGNLPTLHMQSSLESTRFGPVSVISARNGLVVYPHASIEGLAQLQPVYGKQANTVAEGNHTHPPTLIGRFTFDRDGAVLSAGTNTLIDEAVSGLVPGVTYDVQVTGRLEAVNTNNSGRLNLQVQIHTGNHVTSAGFSGGVWTQASADGFRPNVSGMSSINIRFIAEYASGDPTALYAGAVTYRMMPRGGQS